MKLAIFGANGPTGRHLTEFALDEHHEVVAFTRHPDTFPIEHRRLQLASGDVHDITTVSSAPG
ncbi:MAG: NAD(P)H-binding protein [Acidimicrobiales bacterium]